MSQLPDELLLSCIDSKFPGRQAQIRSLAALTDPRTAACRNCLVYGTAATGKTAVVAAVLEALHQVRVSANKPDNGSQGNGLDYAMIKSAECVTGRHLLETTLRKVAEALGLGSSPSRCENLAHLTFELSKMLKYDAQPQQRHFVLVFDEIDRQREAPPTLLPALARLSEIIPRLTTVFIVTNPPPNALLNTLVTHVHFPNYDKAEFVQILSLAPPATLPNTTATESTDLWARFCGAVHDALIKSAARNLPSLQLACDSLWPRFTLPIREGNLTAKDFSKLLIAARVHFQDESLLDPGIIARKAKDAAPAGTGTKFQATVQAMETISSSSSITTTKTAITTTTTTTITPNPGTSLAALLPTTARLLLIAAYLASHNAARHDLTLFSTYHHGRRKRRGGLSVRGGGGAGRVGRPPRNKHRKIAQKLLGAHAFMLERMMAIFATVRHEWGFSDGSSGSSSNINNRGSGSASGGLTAAVDVDVGMALATLSSLRLLVRVGGGGGDPLDRGGKWRVNVGWEVVRGLGRSMGIEVEDWLIE
ncbi:origin recognition complex subunit 5 C-terminus-domain-containing protein [Coniella lustricola]|uniref:Origin recognition complex subunit 5 C-terminus-domain-containing protein n=1 Tax=Coniella lustricola TaxID=2025994 RepID=A0A2T3A5A9_9PEZI|nr:origin recognition complex subunit 5 C-terminus-domain-containing protein [Coniella lustricola]